MLASCSPSLRPLIKFINLLGSEHNKAYHQRIRHPCSEEGCGAIFSYHRDLLKHRRTIHGEPGKEMPTIRVGSAQPASSRTTLVTSDPILEPVPQHNLPGPRAQSGFAKQSQFNNSTYQAPSQDGSQLGLYPWIGLYQDLVQDVSQLQFYPQMDLY